MAQLTLKPTRCIFASKCCRVEYIDTNGNVTTNVVNAVKFRCYFKGSDGDDEVRNNFVVGDQAYCHVTSVDTKDDDPNSKSLNMKHYWRLVVGRNNEGTLTDNGEHWIDLSNNASETLTIKGETYIHLGYQSGSDIPSAQDDIIQLGNINDTDRMGAIIEFVTGADAPSYQIFQGINDFNLNGKNYIGLGYSTQTGRAYLNVYGDAYIGDKPDTQGNAGSYLKYNAGNRQLSIKARVEFTNPDEELDEFVQEHQRDDSYDDTAIRAMIEDVQKQIDGELDTWYYSGVPTLNNEPAKYWNTDDLKREHVGDLYYDRDTGYVYRFLYDDENEVYKWTQIHDDAISEALRIASDAKDTADNKRRVFICDEQHKTPTPPYDQGDLWVNVKYPWATGATYDNEILKCSIPKTGTQTFSISDWSIANGYTAALNEFKNTYNQFVADIKTQVDGKAETWYQATDPSSNWITNELKASHVGDLWCDTSTTGGNKTYIYYDDGQGASPRYLWKEQKVPDMVFDEIDGKADIFVSKPTKYNIDDLWIIESTLSDSDMPSGCKKGDIVISSTSRNNGYNKADWSKKDRYTDDSAFNGYINAVLNGSGSSGDAATVAAAQKAIRDALGGATVVDGGLLLTSLIAMRKYKGTGDIHNSSNYNTWAGISGVRKDTETGTGWKGYGIAAWYGGGMVDHEVSTTATDYAKSLFRFDGSGYLASGNISWDKNGIVTIANVYSNVNGQAVEWSGTSLQYMNNISNSLPLTYQGGTAYFDPKISFTNLSVMGKSVATQEWVSNNYISINFFSRLFRAYNGNTLVNANDTTSTIDNIKAMFGFWTEQYISALGQNSGGGGGGGGEIVLAEPLQSINSAGLGTPRSANVGLVWNGSSWTYGTIGTGSGTVTIVKVGTISYSPTNGVVSLPAYPTTLPASDVSAWAKASTKPSYTLDEVSDGSTRKLSDYTKTTAFKSLSIQGNGTSVGTYSPTSALTVNIAAGSNISITNDTTNHKITIANTYSYTLPNATTSAKGGVIIGNGLSVSDGKVSLGTSGVTAGTYRSVTVDTYGRVTNGTNPTTLAGYGITDAKIASGVITLGSNNITPVTSVGLSAPTGFSVTNTPVTKTGTLTLSYASGYEGFTTTLKNKIDLLYSLFTREGAGTTESPYVIKANYGLYSESFISALGAGSGGSGGGGVGDVTWDLLANNSDTRPIALSHLSGALSGYVTLDTAQTISGLKTMTHGLIVSGRAYGSGDDEGIVVLKSANNIAGVILGEPNSATHAAFYLDSRDKCRFKFKGYNIYHPEKDGTIALTSDIPTNNNQLTNGAGYITSSGSCASASAVPWTGVTNTLVHTNEFNFIDKSVAQATVWFNYRPRNSDSGSSTLITDYKFGDMGSAGGFASLIAAGFKKSGSSDSDVLLGGGGHASYNFSTIAGSLSQAQMNAGLNNLDTGSSVPTDNDYYISQYAGGGTTHTTYYRRPVSALWSYMSGKGDSRYLQLTGGTMTGAAPINFTPDKIAINFRPAHSNYSCKMEYMTSGNEAMVWANQSANTSFIFKCGLDLTNTSDWTGITPSLQIKNQSVYINSLIGSGTTPSYNFYVNGTSYLAGDSVVSGSITVNGGIELGNSNELNGTAAGYYRLHLNYRTTGMVSICYGGGNCGVGTVEPSYKLHVAGSIGGNSLSIANGGRINVQSEPSGATMYIGNSNNAGWVRMQDVCSAAGSTQGDASGWSIRTTGNALFANVQSNGYVTALSDARHKTIINPTDLQVEQIAKMPAVVYRWNDGREDNGLHVGSIAQDWQMVLPEVVLRANDKEGTLSMQYGVAALVSSIITARKVVDHERRIAELERENKELKLKLKIA